MPTTPAHVRAAENLMSVTCGGRITIAGLEADAAVSVYRCQLRDHSQVLKGRHAFEGCVWQGLQVVLVQFSVVKGIATPAQKTEEMGLYVEKGGTG